MKDLSALHHFLGMHVQRSGSGFLLSQRQYMMEILNCASMTDYKFYTGRHQQEAFY